jgi:hypothetical protein
MKQNEFKKMIKEAVREVFLEEMKEILLEAVRSPKAVVTENRQMATSTKSNIPVDVKRNLRSMIGGDGFDTTFSTNSSMAQPAYTPPPVNTAGEGSSLPSGEVGLEQIMGLMSNK